jgi:hypothetical protein
MHNPSEDFLYEKSFAEFNREIFQSDKEGFREVYLDLIKRIEAALWIENIIRSKVLVHDLPTAASRLHGAQLAEFCRVRAALAVSSALPGDLEAGISRVLGNQFFDCYFTGWPFPPHEKFVRWSSGISQSPPPPTNVGAPLIGSGVPDWELQPFQFSSPAEAYQEFLRSSSNGTD